MKSSEILRLDSIHKQFGIKPVLMGIDLSLNAGERAVLVGENGTGKTTLARIIIGDEQADSGTMRLATGAEVGYLPQEVTTHDDVSITDYIAHIAGNLYALRDTMRDIEAQMSATPPPDNMDTLMVRYGDVQEQFALRGGYELDARREAIFAGLGIGYLDATRRIGTLSGGERTRVALAGLLLGAPDLLVLDEPTNHLDFAGIAWLEHYLAQYKGALLIITHDRTFVNKVANQILELNPTSRTLKVYYGDYDSYLAQREREYEEAVSAYHDQQNQMASLQRKAKQIAHSTSTKGVFSDSGDKFLKHFKREGGERLVSQKVRDAKQRLADLQEDALDNPRHIWHIAFPFEPAPLHSTEPIQLKAISKSYSMSLFTNVNTSVYRGQRIALVAPNGAGKSTLLRCIMGEEVLDDGEIRLMAGAIVGYLDQDGEMLDDAMRVLDSLREVMGGDDKAVQAELHRTGLFTDASLPVLRVGDLSVGQRRKLGLARLIASRANVLLLDEPTNHLDLISLEALEDALMGFEGAILAATHDRRFIEKVATHIWYLENGGLRIETRT
jgi:macrolide transport system ATP-binding/permease protein